MWFSIAFITYFVALPKKRFLLDWILFDFLPNCTLNSTELLVDIILFALYSYFQIITLRLKPLYCGLLGIFRSALPSQKFSVIFPRVILSNRLNTMQVIHLPHLPLSYFISALQNIFLQNPTPKHTMIFWNSILSIILLPPIFQFQTSYSPRILLLFQLTYLGNKTAFMIV